jgi:general secretion pathway protein D
VRSPASSSSDKDANVLSTPNLLTLDNEEAKIVIGQNVPFPTGSYASTSGSAGVNPFTTVERKDVGLTLRVRPTINENGTVKLTIFQESQRRRPDHAPEQPTARRPTSARIESSVLVEDGGLIMLGGLLSDSTATRSRRCRSQATFPCWAICSRSEARTREKINLMMFLRPVVMRDADASNSFAYDRYDAIRGLQQRAQPDTSNVMLRAVDGAPVLPADADCIRQPGQGEPASKAPS